MASKPAPAKKKPTTATDDAQEASITTIKKSTCKTLQGTATLTYHIGLPMGWPGWSPAVPDKHPGYSSLDDRSSPKRS